MKGKQIEANQPPFFIFLVQAPSCSQASDFTQAVILILFILPPSYTKWLGLFRHYPLTAKNILLLQ